jgi:nitroreductase
MSRHAPTDHEVLPMVRERWSPRAFDQAEVSTATLRSLLEAARWAPSAYNEQPWRFIVARKQQPEAFARALGLLVEGNQAWAQAAPVLIFGVVKRSYSHNGQPNAHARHDLGQAAAWLTVEATQRGLVVHQMAGVRVEAAREAYGIPEDFEVVTALALGYPGSADQLEGRLAELERAPRRRKPQAEIVFSDAWEQPW